MNVEMQWISIWLNTEHQIYDKICSWLSGCLSAIPKLEFKLTIIYIFSNLITIILMIVSVSKLHHFKSFVIAVSTN